jgi:antitoxin PrlF
MAFDDALLAYSTITAKGQTTVPKSVRQVLGVHSGDQIEFSVQAVGVVMRRATDHRHSDPVIGAFLQFLAHDMRTNPGRLEVLSPDLIDRVRELIDGVEVDIDAPIEGDVAI